ncbi:DUF3099 domain-containing protein [Nocardioides pacificus]
MAERDRRRDSEPVRITTAASSRAEEIAARQRRYLYSMSLRSICFVGAVIADGWLRWVLVAGALVLPYIAVVMANVVPRRRDDFDLQEAGPVAPQIGAAHRTAPLPPGA